MGREGGGRKRREGDGRKGMGLLLRGREGG